MALSNDWEWIILLSLYGFFLFLLLSAYNSSFDKNGVLKQPNVTGNFSCVGQNCSSYNSQSPSDISTPGLGFLDSLSFGLPSGLNIVFVFLFEILPGGILGVLLYRLIRSGGG